MNLINSILVTIAIAAAIWLLLVSQATPVVALANEEPLPEPQQSADVVVSADKTVTSSKILLRAEKLVADAKITRSAAEAAELKRSAAVNPQSDAAVRLPSAIVGITQSMDLSLIDQLWGRFIPQLNQAKQRPEAILVYYRKFNQNFSQATVTIGVAREVLDNGLVAVGLPEQNDYQQVLAKGSRSNTELAAGWNNINYNRKVLSVLEIHYLDVAFNPAESQLFVEYQQ